MNVTYEISQLDMYPKGAPNRIEVKSSDMPWFLQVEAGTYEWIGFRPPRANEVYLMRDQDKTLTMTSIDFPNDEPRAIYKKVINRKCTVTISVEDVYHFTPKTPPKHQEVGFRPPKKGERYLGTGYYKGYSSVHLAIDDVAFPYIVVKEKEV